MKKSKLVYIMDPHCGWCYGNNRSMSDLYDVLQNEYDFEILPGGMWLNGNAPRGGQAIKDFLIPGIIRLNHFSGCEIGDPYIDLVQDSTYLMSSLWPSRAIIAVQELYGNRVFSFTETLMSEQFQKGKRYDIEKTYLDVLEKEDLESNNFSHYWKSEEISDKTLNSFKRAKQLTKSFPSLILQHEKGFEVIQNGAFNAVEVINELNDRKKKVVTSISYK